MDTRKQKATLFAFIVLVSSVNGVQQNRMIYILLWTYTESQPWMYRDLDIDQSQFGFVKRSCTYQNCYITVNRQFFANILDFDVLVFNAIHINNTYSKEDMPINRSKDQLYVFFGVEPAARRPISAMFNGIFNLTWTYKLKSDIVHPYLLVKNNFSEIIAPKIDAYWMNITNMLPIHSTIIEKIRRKSIAALWVVSNCYSKKRWIFVQSLRAELSKYSHRVDIYGECGNQSLCQKVPGERTGLLTSCFSKIESDYYFYLAFENSFTEDYVTEKVLHALLHFSVPIVYGGANYTRFLPNGIYLNALELGVEGLAREMDNIIKNRTRYYDFFKWHNYYSIHDSSADDYRESVCTFCAFLNKRTWRNVEQVYKNITGWWNAPYPEEFFRTTSTAPSFQPGEIVESQYEIPSTPNIFSKIIDFILDFAEFELEE